MLKMCWVLVYLRFHVQSPRPGGRTSQEEEYNIRKKKKTILWRDKFKGVDGGGYGRKESCAYANHI